MRKPKAPQELDWVGPRITLPLGSKERDRETIKWLLLCWDRHKFTLDRWEKTVSEVEGERIYERWPKDNPAGNMDELLKRLIGMDLSESRQRLALADQAKLMAQQAIPLNEHGGDRKSEGRNQGYNYNLETRGTDPEYLTARIARDRPDILERIKKGEFRSVRAAAIEAGIVKVKPKKIGYDQILKLINDNLDENEKTKLAAEISAKKIEVRKKKLDPISHSNENMICPFSMEEIKKRQAASPANRGMEYGPDSPYTKLLIQYAVNQDATEFLDNPDTWGDFTKRELTETEQRDLKLLLKLSGWAISLKVFTGDISLTDASRRFGFDEEWILISARDAKSGVDTIMGSVASDEYKHSFQMAVADTALDREVHPVDFTTLASAAKTIKSNMILSHRHLLAWYIGRVPNSWKIGFRDTPQLLDKVQAALDEARKEQLTDESSEVLISYPR